MQTPAVSLLEGLSWEGEVYGGESASVPDARSLTRARTGEGGLLRPGAGGWLQDTLGPGLEATGHLPRLFI